jgi:hypothetical protein
MSGVTPRTVPREHSVNEAEVEHFRQEIRAALAVHEERSYVPPWPPKPEPAPAARRRRQKETAGRQ